MRLRDRTKVFALLCQQVVLATNQGGVTLKRVPERHNNNLTTAKMGIFLTPFLPTTKAVTENDGRAGGSRQANLLLTGRAAAADQFPL
ncbi:hypothetical protein ElyMa_002007200 [Elysia marginata]|uniref:Uncharacterized protein n=1 Tax=Elysia marginata TaxID=1093978 RepID=A0AAV4F2Y8_9GAST|nr:hypothetical protein ElyMa_002007200 [Elysia marginata]